MNVSLTPKLEEIIQNKIRSGLYSSASEVIREGLRLLQEKDQVREMHLARLREDITAGIEQADNGEVKPMDMGAIKARARGERAAES